MTYLLSAFCIAVGIALIRKPNLFWELEHFLTVKGGDPTKAYMIIKRIIGIVCVCGGIAGIVISLIV